jgi:dTDP-4-dehydrorhamnose reductase
MKILVTGSNGLLGQKLIQLFIDKDIETIGSGLGDDRTGLSGKFYSYISLDITNEQEVMEKVTEHKPDVIINTAAMTNVDQCETEKAACINLNINAVQYIVNACQENGCFLVHLSTDFIFDGEAGPYKEADEPNPISFYGESKLKAEELIVKAEIDHAILRTVLVYGITPNMSRSNIILWVKSSLESGKPIQVVDDQWRTPTLAEDLAMGCFLVADKRATGVFNISGDDLLTPLEMAYKTVEFFDLDKSLITRADSSTFSQPAKRPPKTGFILDKAKKVLGYHPHTFDEGIAILNIQLKK